MESGEDLLHALKREIVEETGWQLRGSPQLIHVADWESGTGASRVQRREFDFLVDIDGHLSQPRLELGKHIQFRWVDRSDLALLDENHGVDDGLVRRLVGLALRSTQQPGFVYPHATIFLVGPEAESVDVLRQEWDPAMAQQVAPHVTVAYPSEVNDVHDLLDRAAHAARLVAPFRLWLGRVASEGAPETWVFIEVEDVVGGWSHLRRLLAHPDSLVSSGSPHVTIVHPRTTNRGAAAWRSLQNRVYDVDLAVKSLAVTQSDGRHFVTVDTFDLGRTHARGQRR